MYLLGKFSLSEKMESVSTKFKYQPLISDNRFPPIQQLKRQYLSFVLNHRFIHRPMDRNNITLKSNRPEWIIN